MLFRSKPVVHLELHTGDLPARPRLLRAAVRLAARAGRHAGHDSYLALELGGGPRRRHRRVRDRRARCGCPTSRCPTIGDGHRARARPRRRRSLLEPREGPAGWRSVVASPAGGEIALWQAKR